MEKNDIISIALRTANEKRLTEILLAYTKIKTELAAKRPELYMKSVEVVLDIRVDGVKKDDGVFYYDIVFSTDSPNVLFVFGQLTGAINNQ